MFETSGDDASRLDETAGHELPILRRTKAYKPVLANSKAVLT